MVENTIQLNTEGSVLSLSTGENNWCEVELQSGNQRYQLGAENKTKIIERLRDGLCKNDLERIGELDGIPVAWVLSLAEKHTSIYVGVGGDTRHFFFQNEDGDTFAKLNLTQETCIIWLQLLKESLC